MQKIWEPHGDPLFGAILSNSRRDAFSGTAFGLASFRDKRSVQKYHGLDNVVLGRLDSWHHQHGAC